MNIESAFAFSESEVWVVIMILLRVSAFVATWPVFGTVPLPAQLKVLLSLGLTSFLFTAVGEASLSPEQNPLQASEVMMFLYAFREILIGVVLGFLGRFFMYVIAIAANLLSLSMGLSSAQVYDPSSSAQVSPVDQFQSAIGVLVYLALDGHYYLLKALKSSYSWFPVGALNFPVFTLANISSFFQDMSVLGIQLAAPALVALLFANIAMAVMGRAVPQINVLVTSLPVNILVGLAVMIVILPLWIDRSPLIVEETMTAVFKFLRT